MPRDGDVVASSCAAVGGTHAQHTGRQVRVQGRAALSRVALVGHQHPHLASKERGKGGAADAERKTERQQERSNPCTAAWCTMAMGTSRFAPIPSGVRQVMLVWENFNTGHGRWSMVTATHTHTHTHWGAWHERVLVRYHVPRAFIITSRVVVREWGN
jgi:hypothetical protein